MVHNTCTPLQFTHINETTRINASTISSRYCSSPVDKLYIYYRLIADCTLFKQTTK